MEWSRTSTTSRLPRRRTVSPRPTADRATVRAFRSSTAESGTTRATGTTWSIGREGDLEVDDNPYLHRQFLQIARKDGIWWLSNVGSMLSATIADASGGMQAWLSPGARIPLVFSDTNVIFTAGPTTYEFAVAPRGARRSGRCARRGQLRRHHDRPGALHDVAEALIVALAEPMLRREGTGFSAIPSSADAAKPWAGP